MCVCVPVDSNINFTFSLLLAPASLACGEHGVFPEVMAGLLACLLAGQSRTNTSSFTQASTLRSNKFSLFWRTLSGRHQTAWRQRRLAPRPTVLFVLR